MVALVSRQGRQLQRYTDSGCRLVVGCIPYKIKVDKPTNGCCIDQMVEVLVISSQKGKQVLFPKGGWESDESIKEAASREALEEAGVQGKVEGSLGKWSFKSRTQDLVKEGIMFPLNVSEELLHWPEMGIRERKWVTVAEAMEACPHSWMREALDRLVKRLSVSSRKQHTLPAQ